MTTITDPHTDASPDALAGPSGPSAQSLGTRRAPDPRSIAVMLGCLQALVVANLVQVAAGFASADPSPPAAVVPGIAATALLGLAAIPMVRSAVRSGYQLGIAFCLASMVGMGPHKLLLPDGATIAPMALVGFALEVVLIAHAVRALRGR